MYFLEISGRTKLSLVISWFIRSVVIFHFSWNNWRKLYHIWRNFAIMYTLFRYLVFQTAVLRFDRNTVFCILYRYFIYFLHYEIFSIYIQKYLIRKLHLCISSLFWTTLRSKLFYISFPLYAKKIQFTNHVVNISTSIRILWITSLDKRRVSCSGVGKLLCMGQIVVGN